MIDVIEIQGANYKKYMYIFKTLIDDNLTCINYTKRKKNTRRKDTLSHYTSKPKDCSLPKLLCGNLVLNM